MNYRMSNLGDILIDKKYPPGHPLCSMRAGDFTYGRNMLLLK